MKKFIAVLFLLVCTAIETFAYSIKVYDEQGTRIGTYKKEGDNYQFYDMDDKKAENPSGIIRFYPVINNYYPPGFFDTNIPYVSRPNPYANPNILKYAEYKEDLYYVDSRYPKLHQFK